MALNSLSESLPLLQMKPSETQWNEISINMVWVVGDNKVSEQYLLHYC